MARSFEQEYAEALNLVSGEMEYPDWLESMYDARIRNVEGIVSQARREKSLNFRVWFDDSGNMHHTVTRQGA